MHMHLLEHFLSLLFLVYTQAGELNLFPFQVRKQNKYTVNNSRYAVRFDRKPGVSCVVSSETSVCLKKEWMPTKSQGSAN